MTPLKKVTTKRVPFPFSLVTDMLPFWLSMIIPAKASPIPTLSVLTELLPL